MKDIKSLYLSVRSNPSTANIKNYTEAINSIIQNKPFNYISNLEYIISSSIGLSTVSKFIKENGLPIAVFDELMSVLEKSIEKCNSKNIKCNEYIEAYNNLLDFRNNNKKAFMMFDYYKEGLDKSYIENFYQKNDKGIQNRYIASGMIKLYNEASIPDLFINSESKDIGKKLLEYVINNYSDNKVLVEWCIEVYSEKYKESINQPLLESYSNIKEEFHKSFRESVICGKPLSYSISDENINDLKSIIEMKEFQLTYQDELTENEIKSLNNDIKDIYSILLEYEEGCADLVQMLPSTRRNDIEVVRETTWMSNTRDKKTGSSPAYIKTNHNMAKWGEEDEEDKDKDNDKENELDKYKRPENKNDKSTIDNDIDFSNDDMSDTSSIDNDVKQTSSNGVTNYYYYTYNNSLNKNTNSYNKDNSTHDHSVKNSHNTEIKESNIGKNLFNFGKKLINKGKSLYHFITKKTLKNLQSLSKPKRTITDPLFIPGTTIPMRNTTGIKESSTPLTESPKKNITIDEMKKIVEDFRKEFNINVVFISDKLDESILSAIGAMTYGEFTKEDIAKLTNGGDVRSISNKLFGDEGEFEKTILVNPTLFFDLDIMNAEAVKLLLKHEYGHSLTFHQIDQRDFIDYKVKENLLSNLFKIAYPDDPNVIANLNLQYYKLKTEKLANEIMNIDPYELTYVIFGVRPKDNLPKIDADIIINWNMPDSVYKLNKEVMLGKEPPAESIVEVLNATKELYKKCVKDKEVLSSLLTSINNTLSYYSKALKESSVDTLEHIFTLDIGIDKPIFEDVDDDRPKSDHPIRDTLLDIDRVLTRKQQQAKKTVQDIQNVGRAVLKPFKRTNDWINSLINQWKDYDETKIKEKLTDPHARKNIFSAIKTAIIGGSLVKAGILLNPVFLFLTITKGISRNKNEFRLRNEIIGELKTELEIIDEKIKDADQANDNKAKYQLMRFKNELNKKLLRVGGGKRWAKII